MHSDELDRSRPAAPAEPFKIGVTILNGLRVLIAEDDPSVSSELAFMIEYFDARAVGPVMTVAGAFALLEKEKIAAAIVDTSLLDQDVTPLALKLVEQAVPFVVHTRAGIPAASAERYPDLPVIKKPARAMPCSRHSFSVLRMTTAASLLTIRPVATGHHGRPSGSSSFLQRRVLHAVS